MKSWKLGTLLVTAAMLTLSPLAEAKTKKKKTTDDSATQSAPAKKTGESSSGRGYGVSGCGLGSIVFGPKPGMIQIVAATLNGTGMQTIGITAGTSNCDIPEMGQQAAVFIEVNKEIVKKDASRGNGETLESLSQILGCSDAKAFGRMIQSNYSEIFSDENNSYESTRRILNSIKADKNLVTTCETLG